MPQNDDRPSAALPANRIFLSVDEMAGMIPCTRACVLRWIARGDLATYRVQGRPFIAIESARRFLDSLPPGWPPSPEVSAARRGAAMRRLRFGPRTRNIGERGRASEARRLAAERKQDEERRAEARKAAAEAAEAARAQRAAEIAAAEAAALAQPPRPRRKRAGKAKPPPPDLAPEPPPAAKPSSKSSSRRRAAPQAVE